MTNEEAIKIGKTRQGCLKAQNDGRCKCNLIPNYCNKGCEYNTSDKEYDEFETLAIVALEQNVKLKEAIEKIDKWVHSGNRGNCDYFIVDQIEEIINGLKKDGKVSE